MIKCGGRLYSAYEKHREGEGDCAEAAEMWAGLALNQRGPLPSSNSRLPATSAF